MESPSPAPEAMSTPPKLSLFSLPSKPPTLPDGLTPPPNTVATIPFLWEEAPGKPRLISTTTTTTTTTDDPPKSKTVRSLDLPPRLAAAASPFHNGNNHPDKLGNNIRIEVIPSPTTVLGGPYNSKSLLGSPEKVVVVSSKAKGNMRMPLRNLMMKEKSPVKFSSWRWDSFRNNGGGGGREDRSPSPVKLCSWRWDSFRDMIGDGGSGGKGGGGSLDPSGKIRKVARRNSFTFGTGANSGFLANVYGSLKQAMPWRSRR